MVFRHSVHTCDECARRLSSFSVMTFRYLRCGECGGAWLSHSTLHGMFNEMRAGARVEMEARPREADTPTILALKVAGGEQVLFSEEAIIKIGSLDSCHLVLDHPSVSRMHAVIEFNGRGVATLIDLGSASGTRVNDAPINKVNLEHGDLLGFGNLSVKVSMLAKDPRPSDSGRGCVECRTPMVRQYLQGVEVDVCPAHGAWFDAKELQTILHRLTE